MVKEAITSLTADQKNSISNLKPEIRELKESQEFVCAKYDSLKQEDDPVERVNTKQAEKLKQLTENSVELEKRTETETYKLDQIEQHERRQNLEFHGISENANENVAKIVVYISKTLGVNIT